jgi:rhodanese-related sulfurtransferase
MRIALTLAVVLAIGVAAYLVFGRGREIQGGDARKLVAAGARLLDVRSPEEYARGHLPGALNIPVQELDRRVAEVGPTDGELVVYCRSGHRSSRAAEILRQHGFSKVHNLGPMTAW